MICPQAATSNFETRQKWRVFFCLQHSIKGRVQCVILRLIESKTPAHALFGLARRSGRHVISKSGSVLFLNPKQEGAARAPFALAAPFVFALHVPSSPASARLRLLSACSAFLAPRSVRVWLVCLRREVPLCACLLEHGDLVGHDGGLEVYPAARDFAEPTVKTGLCAVHHCVA